jgi:hypothetical protein
MFTLTVLNLFFFPDLRLLRVFPLIDLHQLIICPRKCWFLLIKYTVVT